LKRVCLSITQRIGPGVSSGVGATDGKVGVRRFALAGTLASGLPEQRAREARA
jgi:hypothetical protein